jgi:RNA polymerase primary sigma factor
MPRYRLDSIADLARQMQFTPLATRAAQVTSAEGVLHDIDPAKAYPLDWLVFRLTGYRPKSAPKDLLTGLALQHDLGLLIEQVSESLNQRTDDLDQAVLSLDEATQRFNITSKTLQRWRRRGLSGRRLIFPDGKRRIGFLLSNLERFLAVHSRQAMTVANFSSLDAAEQQKILVAARRLVAAGSATHEITHRLGKKFNRSPLLIEQMIRDLLPSAVLEIADEQRSKIFRRYRRGVTLSEMSRTFAGRKSTLYRIIMDERLARITQRKAKFIDDPLYHQADAQLAIEAIAAQQPVTDAPNLLRPRAAVSMLQTLSDHPVLTESQERALFLKFNFHKYQFVISRRRLDERAATHRQLRTIERHLADATKVRNQLVAANLRLLINIARRHARGCVGLMDLISDGTLTLMRAVDSYDFHKGHHFATYATFGVMKEFARSSGRMIARHLKSAALSHDVVDTASHRRNELFLDNEHLTQLLAELTESEQAVLRSHYGLDGRVPAGTYRQTARQLGISPQQVRHIEETALAKLRACANTPI